MAAPAAAHPGWAIPLWSWPTPGGQATVSGGTIGAALQNLGAGGGLTGLQTAFSGCTIAALQAINPLPLPGGLVAGNVGATVAQCAAGRPAALAAVIANVTAAYQALGR